MANIKTQSPETQNLMMLSLSLSQTIQTCSVYSWIFFDVQILELHVGQTIRRQTDLPIDDYTGFQSSPVNCNGLILPLSGFYQSLIELL